MNTIKLEGASEYSYLFKNLNVELDDNMKASFARLGVAMIHALPFDDALQIVHKNIEERQRKKSLISDVVIFMPVISEYRWHIKGYGDKIVRIMCATRGDMIVNRKRTETHPYYFVGQDNGKIPMFKKIIKNSSIEQHQLFVTRESDVHIHSYFYPDKIQKMMIGSFSAICNVIAHVYVAAIPQYKEKICELNLIAAKHFFNDIVLSVETESGRKKDEGAKKDCFKKEFDAMDIVIVIEGEHMYNSVHTNLISLDLEKID